MDVRHLLNDTPCHIVLLVVDGLGGYADGDHGSELEDARTPNLDRLATQGMTGLTHPVGPGITAGSGPGHLALFGYDPTEYRLGRGVLSAAGVEFDLRPGDVAARGNLATLDDQGQVASRRAGRIGDEAAQAITARLSERVELDDVEVFFRHISEHRVLVVLRGDDLDPRVNDLDPQREGLPPREPIAQDPAAEHTADVLKRLDNAMRTALDGEQVDAVLLRGFDTFHELPSFRQRYGLHAATVARYPMYRGVARLVGMAVLPKTHSPPEQVGLMRQHWDSHDYFFMHEKDTDRAGHDGERDAKIAAIEGIDAVVPDIVALDPDVLVVTGDHSTPTQLSAHSWHPVPTLIWGPSVGRDEVTSFGERACAHGLLGQCRGVDLMPIMLASALRLEKFGA
ncbi:MAG: 2,3-bisphosphoglycerate-independent phosphoglycerate mutase [Actinomycetota bacterium]|nr:2,3-bisphosphoglycerate-independent phosphoglycerate mutase [Actinomycetota bacterium]